MSATTYEQLHEWFNEGKKAKATHMIIVCDTFEWDDYPVYVTKHENVHKKEDEYRAKSMTQIMEVYCLTKRWDKQTIKQTAFGKRVFDYS